jgi:hypothetical protein
MTAAQDVHYRLSSHVDKRQTMVTHQSNSNGGNNSNSDFSKKDEFRRYLEKSGVLDALTKVLVGLYEEPDRPNNALDYMKRYLGAPSAVDIDGIKQENSELNIQIEKMKKQLAELQE